MEANDVLKGVINALPGKSGTGSSDSNYKDTDLIQIYGSDGTPTGKIARTDLMSCIKDSLGSLLNAGADQTTVTKVPTLNGNTFGASTIATLASVLGERLRGASVYNGDLNDLKAGDVAYTSETTQHSPGAYVLVVTYGNPSPLYDREQIGYAAGTRHLYYRCSSGTRWSDWGDVTFDMPSFYKGYGTLNALASALGGVQVISSPRNVDFDSVRPTGLNVYITDNDTNPANLPTAYQYGFVFIIGAGETIFQVACDYVHSCFQCRSYQFETSGWSTWKNIGN